MISLPAGTCIWLVAGITDMRNGFNGLASKVQNVLNDDPFSGHLFIFRGRRGNMVSYCGPMRMVCACLSSAWSTDTSSGPPSVTAKSR